MGVAQLFIVSHRGAPLVFTLKWRNRRPFWNFMLVFEKHQIDFGLGGGVQGLGRDNQNKYLCLQKVTWAQRPCRTWLSRCGQGAAAPMALRSALLISRPQTSLPRRVKVARALIKSWLVGGLQCGSLYWDVCGIMEDSVNSAVTFLIYLPPLPPSLTS